MAATLRATSPVLLIPLPRPREHARASDALRSAPPVLLVHGFASSSRVMLPLERRLRRKLARPIVRVANPGMGALQLQDIRKSARALGSVLDELTRRREVEFVDIVGHSMGGLVAAYVLKHLDCGRRIRRVVTLGTPHLGAPAALLGLLAFGLVSRAIWQMLPRSSFLEELQRRPVPRNSELISIAAQGDSLVPPSRSRLPVQPGHGNLTVEASSHIELLLSSNVSDLVSEALASPLPLAA